jgi:hypothetical protein
MATQRRDYRKNTDESQTQPRVKKEGTPVNHPTDNPGASPDFDPNAPPEGTTATDDGVVQGIPPEQGDMFPDDDEKWRHKEDDQFDKKVPTPPDGTDDDTGGPEAA